MGKCCIICYRIFDKNKNRSKEIQLDPNNLADKLLKRFFKLLQRHFENGGGNRREKTFSKNKSYENFTQLINKLIDNGQMSGCEECLKIVDSFCNHFHQMQLMELTVNFKLLTLSNIMTSAENFSSREENLTEIFTVDDNTDDQPIHLLKRIKKELINLCSETLSQSFPRVSLKKCADKLNLNLKESVNSSNRNAHSSIDEDSAQTVNNSSKEDNKYKIANQASDKIIKTEKLPMISSLAGNNEDLDDHDYPDHCNFIDTENGTETELIPFSREDCSVSSHFNNLCTKENSKKTLAKGTTSRKRKNVTEIEAEELCTTKRSLRKIHRCSDCNRTFSTNESLSKHDCCKETWDNEDNERPVDTIEQSAIEGHQNDNSNDEFQFDVKAIKTADPDYIDEADDSSNEGDNFNLSCSSTSSSDDENADEDRSDWDEKNDKKVVTLIPQKTYEHYRLKCPTPKCSSLFYSVPDLLLHYQNCKNPEQLATEKTASESETISVNIWFFPTKDQLKTRNSETFNNSRIVTTMKISTFIKFCEIDNCRRPFYTGADLESHKRLHGTFKCQFCPIVKNYAPFLSLHELKHSSPVNDAKDKPKVKSKKKIKINKRETLPRLKCPRCDLTFRQKGKQLSYLHHHLSSHLSLTYVDSNCPICKSSIVTNTPTIQKFNHFRNHHDLNNLEEADDSRLHPCPTDNCQAYFRTKDQLSFHNKLRHNQINLDDKYKCQDCGISYYSSTGLRHHRLKSHVNPKDMLSCTHPNCLVKFETVQHRISHTRSKHSIKMKPIRCPKCSKLYFGIGKFTLHMKAHKRRPIKATKIKKERNPVTLRRYKCPNFECSKLFKNCSELLLHYKTHETVSINPGDLLTINIVTLDNKTMKPIEDYAIIKVPRANVFICPIETCGMTFMSQEILTAHQKLHGTFKCHFCNFTKTYAPDLAAHERDHFKKKKKRNQTLKKSERSESKKECPRCDCQFILKNNYFHHHLKEHMSLSLPQNEESVCPVCNLQSKDKNCKLTKMMIHIKLQHNLQKNPDSPKRTCKLPGCSAYFLSRHQLIRHQKAVHHQNPQQFKQLVNDACELKCADCDKILCSRFSLKNHRLKKHQIAERANVIKCPFDNCHAVMECEEDLKNHTSRIHSQKMVHCSKCDKTMSSTLYGTHLRFHEMKEKKEAGLLKSSPKEKQHICEKCGKIFKNKYGLQKHFPYHLSPDEWEFQCDTCSRKRPTKYALAAHMRVHSNEKPFVCQVCGVKYAHRHNLRNHINSKHSDVMQDLPRKQSTANMASTRKGKKIKQQISKKSQKLNSSEESDS